MDSFEVNKILGAILATCLGVLSINIAAGAIFAPVKPAKPGYEIGVPEQAPAGKPAEQEKQESIEQLRALEAGMRSAAPIVDSVPLGVDTPADLERAREILKPPAT